MDKFLEAESEYIERYTLAVSQHIREMAGSAKVETEQELAGLCLAVRKEMGTMWYLNRNLFDTLVAEMRERYVRMRAELKHQSAAEKSEQDAAADIDPESEMAKYILTDLARLNTSALDMNMKLDISTSGLKYLEKKHLDLRDTISSTCNMVRQRDIEEQKMSHILNYFFIVFFAVTLLIVVGRFLKLFGIADHSVFWFPYRAVYVLLQSIVRLWAAIFCIAVRLSRRAAKRHSAEEAEEHTNYL